MGVTFQTSSGKDPVAYILELADRAKPRQADAMFGAQRQKTRMVERTLRGVDVEGRPFEPYDTTRPYYYYPNGSVGRDKPTAKRNKAAVKRLLKVIGDVEAGYFQFDAGHEGFSTKRTRSGQGIRFDSYAAFKASLGRGGVDLTGPRAPHMLQAIEAKVQTNGSAATGFTLGIYGDAAARATAHNTGINPRWKRRHQRWFFGASAADIREIASDIMMCIYRRISNRV